MNDTDSISQLKGEFVDRAKSPEILFLLKPRDALDFIDSGCARGLSMVGVEGFVLTGRGAYQPCQEFSNDIADSRLSDHEFIESTKQLIREGERKNIWFEVVFDHSTD